MPKSYYEGALALGATKERAIFRTMFPAAASGIMTAIVLGIGRAIGETAAVSLVCGNVPQIPTDLSMPFMTLASAIASGMGYSSSGFPLEVLISCAAVLFVFILIITILIMLLKRKSR